MKRVIIFSHYNNYNIKEMIQTSVHIEIESNDILFTKDILSTM